MLLIAKRVVLAFVFLIFFVRLGFSQSFYISEGFDLNDVWKVHRITLNSTGYTDQVLDVGPFPDKYFSIAVQGNVFYYINNSSELIKADIVGDKLVNYELLMYVPYANSLTIDDKGILYFASGQELYKYDNSVGKLTKLGVMPYYSSGDLLFYQKDLYMAASQGIIKLNLNDLSQSSIYISMTGTPWEGEVFGLTSVALSKDKNKVYALAFDYNNRNTAMVSLDMENRVILGTDNTLPYGVLDAASEVEDGTFIGIKLDKIKQFDDCNNPGKGIIKVETAPHSAIYTYTLNGVTSNTNGVFHDLLPGTYQLNIKSANDSKDITFTINNFTSTTPVVLAAKKEPMCDVGGEIDITTEENGEVYTIRYGTDIYPSDHTFIGLAPGSYHFEVLNEINCVVKQLDVNLTKQKCNIKFKQINIKQECNLLGKAKVEVITDAHNDLYTYALNGQSNNTGLFNLIEPGNYQLKITSSEDEQTYSVNIPDYNLSRPAIIYSKKKPVCDLAGEIKFNAPAGDSYPYKVLFNGNSYPLDHLFTGLLPNKYHFGITDAQGCLVNEFDIELVQDKCEIKFDRAQVTQTCDAVAKGDIQIFTLPHSDLYTYTLNGISNHTGFFGKLNAGTYLVKITSPEDEKQVSAIIPDYSLNEPVVTYDFVNPACADKGTVQFKMPGNSAGYAIRYNSNIYSFEHIFTGLVDGKHQFTILKPDGCVSDIKEVALAYQPCQVVVNNISAVPECMVLGKGVVTVSARNVPETYTYYLTGPNGVITSSTGIFDMLDPGNYTVKVTASGGNTSSDIPVSVPNSMLNKVPVMINRVNQLCDIPGSINLMVGNNSALYKVAFQNSTYASDHNFSMLYAGTYHFDILNADGCMANSIDVELTQESCNMVSFPNTFTPNNDGINDFFKPNEDSRANKYQLTIYNRYGELLFISKDMHKGWDGQSKGKPLPASTYYWIAEYIDDKGKNAVQNGYITLIR